MAAISNVGLFGTETRSRTLLVIHMLGESHPSEIAAVLGRSLSRIQAAVESLERAGVVIGVQEGRTHRVRLNPRYPAAEELGALLGKLGLLDIELQRALAAKRRRPRRLAKSLAITDPS